MRSDTPGGSEAPTAIVGVEGSEHARTAALRGPAEARRHRQGLRLAHAGGVDRLDRFASFGTSQRVLERGRGLLRELAGEAGHGFPGLDAALEPRREKPDSQMGHTVVVGGSASGGFGPPLLGSVEPGAAMAGGLPLLAAERDAEWVAQTAREARAVVRVLRLLRVRSSPAMRTQVVTARWAAAGLVGASRDADPLIVGSRKRRKSLGLGTSFSCLLHHAHCPGRIVPCTDEEAATTAHQLGDGR